MARHQLYRATAWLDEECAKQDRNGLVPRTTKELIEERLLAQRRDLFSEAERDRALHERIFDQLAAELAQGEVGLVRNRAWQRYLRPAGPGPAFVIDAAKVAADARHDGTFVLRSNTTLAPLLVLMR